ncbi:MAG: cryptochrome/photolyase family protein [Caldilineaceae bacterium]
MTCLTVWILGDQLIIPHPALTWAEEQGATVRVVMVESRRRRRKMPYHRRRLVLLLSAMRHYAQELREKGYEVDYVVADSFEDGLRRHCAEHKPDALVTMAASHYAGRQFQRHRLADVVGVPVEVVDNRQFLVELFNPYPDPEPGRRYVMEHFYRAMRRHFDVLMQGDDPVGGQWNFDKDNRKPLPKDAQPPQAPSFTVDEITQQVIDEITAETDAETDAHYVGSLDDFDLAVTRQQASSALGNFIAHRLADFGPYEDAMSQNEETLWHSVLSPYLNLGLLEPMQLIDAAQRAYHEEAHADPVSGRLRAPDFGLA